MKGFLCAVGVWTILLTAGGWCFGAPVTWADNAVRVAVPSADAFTELADGVNRLVSATGCTAGVIIKDLRREDAIFVNKDLVFPAASLIKIPIMVTVFNQADAARINLADTIVLQEWHKVEGSGILKYCPAGSVWSFNELLSLMIVKSDNTAADMLLAEVGMVAVNRQMRELGLTATRVRRTILDFAAIRRGVENTTTAYEMMQLLELIYEGRAASRESCREMLQILLEQEYNDRIPRAMPADIAVAHKTGTMRRLAHDVGIVFLPQQEFVICVLLQGMSEEPSERLIGQVAEEAFDYFTEQRDQQVYHAGLLAEINGE